jgi:uncharacterized protein YbjT (DUF2867 family)
MQSSRANESLILVLGGRGKTGRRVVERLQRAGYAVRIGSRSGEPPFDWDDPRSWEPALRGVAAAYVTFQPDIAVPGALETLRAFFDCAVVCGVAKIVFLSGRGEVEAERAEQLLVATGDAIVAGELAAPVGSVAEPFVDVEDIADVAFAALTQPRHARQLYEITGPRALTFTDAVAEIARATDRTITFVPVSVDEYRAELVRQRLPAEEIDLILYLFTTVLDGRNTPLTNGVTRALGRAPRDFREFARDAAAAGMWNVVDALPGLSKP